MYRLMVVEDEDFVRETIVSCIDWPAIGFQVMEAEDGEMALELAREFRPDAVVTDVKMPIMDGLELTQALRRELPDTLVVVLSGHDEFRFAQRALELGVMEYITKPILPSEFTDAMKRLRDRVHARERQRENIEKLQTQLHQSLPLLRERFLNRLVSRPLPPEEIRQKLGLLELQLDAAAYAVLVFSGWAEEEPGAPDADELILFALHNVIAEEIGDRGVCFNDSMNRLVMVYRILDPEEEDREILFTLADALRRSNQYVLSFTITAAIGATVEALEELPLSYSTAVTSLEQQLLLGKNRVYDYQDFIHLERDEFRIFNQIEDLTTSFHFEQSDAFIGRLRAFFTSMAPQDGQVNPHSVRAALIELLGGVHRVLLEAGLPLPADASALYAHIFHMEHMEELLPELERYMLQAREAMQSAGSRSASLVQGVCAYIKQNYGDPELSLNKAAEQASISPVYLSTLFKRELGITFVDYVTSTRLEAAKKYLLAGGAKNYEVAHKVGYNDPQYFSNCFKKYAGMTPSEYRATKGG